MQSSLRTKITALLSYSPHSQIDAEAYSTHAWWISTGLYTWYYAIYIMKIPQTRTCFSLGLISACQKTSFLELIHRPDSWQQFGIQKKMIVLGASPHPPLSFSFPQPLSQNFAETAKIFKEPWTPLQEPQRRAEPTGLPCHQRRAICSAGIVLRLLSHPECLFLSFLSGKLHGLFISRSLRCF